MDPLTRRLILDDHYLPDVDIRLFLTSIFEDIKKSHPLRSQIPFSWPSDLEVEILVQKSSGQFIYASTVMKFIQSYRYRPADRLKIILRLLTSGMQNPFSELDALYMHIITSAEDTEKTMNVFAYLLLVLPEDHPMVYSGGTRTPDSIEKFLEYEPGDLQVMILADLHSVLFVPPPDSQHHDLRVYHASLGDFLMDKSRSGQFFIATPKTFARMAEHCIKHTSMIPKLISTLPIPKADHSNISKEFQQLDIHYHLSFQCFMELCTNAYPTQELLQALTSFTFNSFLTLSSLSIGDQAFSPWSLMATSFPGFMEWLHMQCSPTRSGNCLCRRYMTDFDSYLYAILLEYSSTDPEWRNIWIAFTLDSCVFNHYCLNTVIADSVSDERGMQWFGAIPKDKPSYGSYGNAKYRSLVIAFLLDRARSGPYCVDKTQYVQLAIKCIDYLHFYPTPTYRRMSTEYRIRRRAEDRMQADQCASEITLDVLLRFPQEPKLVKYLRKHRVAEDVNQRDHTILAIEAYIQDYDRNKKKRWKWPWASFFINLLGFRDIDGYS